MAEKKIFVGRKAELEQFGKALEDPQGQAVLVVGQAGMGKTWLVNKMAEVAENHPDLKCGWVRYEVTPTDSVDSTMALMMDNAFEAAQVAEGSFDGTERRLEQWRSLLNVINIGDLVMNLRRDPQRNMRDQFMKWLRLISNQMPEDGRAVFIIDPEKYMQEKSDQSWAIVVRQLPKKIKFVFVQRLEDVLVGSETFEAQDNVVRVPEKRLDVLSEEDIDELVKCRRAKLPVSIPELQKVLKRYNGHPYAIGATLDLIEGGIKLEELPEKPEPTKFAEVQWKKVCESEDGAIELFETYAILEVAVPNDVVQAVSNLKTSKLKKLLADKYLSGLLRKEGEGRRIYHLLLANYILKRISGGEKKGYHSRAVKVYRGKLKKAAKEQTKPDALAAMRLPEHVLAAEGKEAFVYACAYECYRPLDMLGLLDTALSFSQRALEFASVDSKEEAAVRCTLGLLYRTKGDLNKAEKMHIRALEIEGEGQREEGMAREYGNLGLIYQTRGELDKAEEMFIKILEIHKKLGDQEGMANDYSNLGLIYRRRGDLDEAEEMFRDGLKIDEKLGRLEGMAAEYGNLGLIYRRRGDLDKAEEMFAKILDIHKELGHQVGMANDYGNLGLVYEERGDIAKAREYLEKAVELYKKIGMPDMVERLEGWLERIGDHK